MINTRFAQDCPTCGRKLFVRRAYLQRRVICQHCQAEFTATEDKSFDVQTLPWRQSLIQRADELLHRVESTSV